MPFADEEVRKSYLQDYYLKNREIIIQRSRNRYTNRDQKKHARDARERSLNNMFSITVEDYETILAAQGGVCAICHKPPTTKKLAVDHDRTCCPGKKSCGMCIRGLIHVGCNASLGWFENHMNPVFMYFHAYSQDAFHGEF